MNNFPRFWFESKFAWGWIEKPEDFNRIVDAHKGVMTKEELIDNSRNAFNDTFNFGLNPKHSGNIYLRDFLYNNNVEL
jgi:hypothetical protein